MARTITTMMMIQTQVDMGIPFVGDSRLCVWRACDHIRGITERARQSARERRRGARYFTRMFFRCGRRPGLLNETNDER